MKILLWYYSLPILSPWYIVIDIYWYFVLFLILINVLVLVDKGNMFFLYPYFLKHVYNTVSSFFSHWSYCLWKLTEFGSCVKLLLNIVESFVIYVNFVSLSPVNLHCVLFCYSCFFLSIFICMLNMNALWSLHVFLSFLISYFVRAYGYTFFN